MKSTKLSFPLITVSFKDMVCIIIYKSRAFGIGARAGEPKNFPHTCDAFYFFN